MHGRLAVASVVSLWLGGCASGPAHDPQSANPLGPSFWVLPTPSEDASLLGRILRSPPRIGFTLEEQSEPNPCEATLASEATYAMTNRYENILAEGRAGDASGVFQLYGFSATARDASHLVYRVTTAQRRNRLDTLEYQQCCRERDCGWGYVSSLLYGEGEYASAREGEEGARAEGPMFVLEGRRTFRVLEQKRVQGWLAAVLTPHDRTEVTRACPAGEEWHGGECVSVDWIQTAKFVCRTDRAADPFWKDDPNMRHTLERQRKEACFWLEEHGIDAGPMSER